MFFSTFEIDTLLLTPNHYNQYVCLINTLKSNKE